MEPENRIPYGIARPILDRLYDDGIISDYEWATEPTEKLPNDIIHITAHNGVVLSIFENCADKTERIGWLMYRHMGDVGTARSVGGGKVDPKDLERFIKSWAS